MDLLECPECGAWAEFRRIFANYGWIQCDKCGESKPCRVDEDGRLSKPEDGEPDETEI